MVGVIPQTLMQREVGHLALSEQHVVPDMHVRKRTMAERADAFVALPGGIGTLEELFEVWTWRQLGYHDKPIGLLNSGGYFDAMLAFLQASVDREFMNDWQMDLIRVDTQVESLLEELVQAAGLAPAPRLEGI